MAERLELSEKERKFSYSKYYDLPMTEISEEKKYIIQQGPMSYMDGLTIERRTELFLPGYQKVETGYCIMADGTGYLANLTKMPGVTPEMFEWWFAWHALEDLRYRIWDPEDHFYARQQNLEKVLDPKVPMREKTWGTTHLIMEDVGLGASDLTLKFFYPSELGFDESKVGTKDCAALICAMGHSPVAVNAIMTHFVRETEEGTELRSRFWIGYRLENGNVIKVIPDGVEVPVVVARSLLNHCMKEFTHLAAILPQVYKENKDRW